MIFDRATAATAALVFALISVSSCALAQGAPRSVIHTNQVPPLWRPARNTRRPS